MVLFYANGTTPVVAQLVFTGEVLPDTGRVRLTAGGGSAADRVGPGRPGRLGGEREEHDRPEQADVLPPQPRSAHPVSSARRERPGTLPARRFPFSAHFGFQDGSHDDRFDHRALPAAPARR